MKTASEILSNTLMLGLEEVLSPCLFLAGCKTALSTSDRSELLDRVRSGESIQIEVEAVTYIQRDTPNRNAIRFKNTLATLRKIAKSGKGNPFLRDHDQDYILSRGGTVLESKAEKVGDETHFKQRLLLVKPWAVEGALDGTIDRFSIGWYPTGPIVYSHNNEEVVGWPDYFPGDSLEDGTIVEWVYTSAELIEVSGVNVPAVTGTHIEGIKSALSAALPQSRNKFSKEELKMSKKILLALGLNETASDDVASAAIGELQTTAKRQATELSALGVQLAQVNEALAVANKEGEARKAEKLESDIHALYKAGKLTAGHGGATGVQNDPLEKQLRDLHAVGGQEMFDGFVANLAIKVPSQELQSSNPAPDPGSAGYDSSRLRRLSLSGMSPERHAELAAKKQLMGGN